MKRRHFLIGGAAAPFIAGPVAAAAAAAASRVEGARALAGDRFIAGASEHILTDIISPALYDLRRKAQPYFMNAKSTFDEMLVGCQVMMQDDASSNRWGARRVTAWCDGDRETLQEKLVAAGAARVDPMTDNHGLIDRLLEVEGVARRARRGLWAEEAYQVFAADDAEAAVGAFHLVEGRISDATTVRGRVYLNFGDDFREDFTVTTKAKSARRWSEQGLDLEALSGAFIRARGMVEMINGPSIELEHPKAIEVIKKASA